LVLALPILLFVTALMINFGTLAAWRVRGEIVSRDAAWRAQWPRTGQREAASRVWPPNAVSETRGGPEITALDHPELHHAVVRGPLPNGFTVKGVLDPVCGYHEGLASIVRPYPLLPRLGSYRSGEIEHPLLDQPWTCSQMGIPNLSRRTEVLYDLPATDQRLPRALAAAGNSLFAMRNYPALFVLDQDADILHYRGSYVDFHPRLRHPYPAGRLVVTERCQLDPEVVWNQEVERLVDSMDDQGRVRLRQISRLPRTLTNYFLDMYDSRVRALKASIPRWSAELRDRDTSSERRRQLRVLIAEGERELARLEPFVKALEAYQTRLGQIEDHLRAQFRAQVAPEGVL
jgi:hypothetical protein